MQEAHDLCEGPVLDLTLTEPQFPDLQSGKIFEILESWYENEWDNVRKGIITGSGIWNKLHKW